MNQDSRNWNCGEHYFSNLRNECDIDLRMAQDQISTEFMNHSVNVLWKLSAFIANRSILFSMDTHKSCCRSRMSWTVWRTQYCSFQKFQNAPRISCYLSSSLPQPVLYHPSELTGHFLVEIYCCVHALRSSNTVEHITQ